MPDYQQMYHILFKEMSKAIEILQKAQCEAEEVYMTFPEFFDVIENADRKIICLDKQDTAK